MEPPQPLSRPHQVILGLQKKTDATQNRYPDQLRKDRQDFCNNQLENCAQEYQQIHSGIFSFLREL